MNEPNEFAAHGGNLTAIGRAHDIDPRTLLDFSANVNPLGPPISLLHALREAANDSEHLAHYPEPTYAALRRALANVHAIDVESIVIGNGGASLIGAAIAAFGVRRALVPTPAFSEYRHAFAARGATLVPAPLDREHDFALDCDRFIALAIENGVDCVLLNTPHNPTGSRIAHEDVARIVTAGIRHGWRTIVDEAFADYDESQSVIALGVRNDRLIVVRSLTKFFAVPALRVGFAVASPKNAKRVRSSLPSWPVTTLAARALEAAIADRPYALRTRTANETARGALRDGLIAIGLRPLPTFANYLCIELPAHVRSTDVVARAIADHRIVVRDCANYDGLEDGRYIRVAVRNPGDNDRLIAALHAVCGTQKQENIGEFPTLAP